MLSILIVLIVVGVALWLLNAYVPMAQPIKTIVNVLVVLFTLIWLLSATGVLNAPGLRLR